MAASKAHASGGVRRAAVAGRFYPADPVELEATVRRLLDGAVTDRGQAPPKALIVPHAGYVYSGPIAASGYVALRGQASVVRRVVLIGPSHYVPLRGLAASSAAAFESPIGQVPVDRDATQRVLGLPQVRILDEAHRAEHSLEVHLPFLQCVLAEVSLVPLVAGAASAEEIAEVLDELWNGPGTVIVVSSDLSHYHDYTTARDLDAATSRAIEALQPEALGEESACGRIPARGLLVAARRHGLRARTVDLRNSGDTAGPRDSVVGYGAYLLS